MMETVTSHKQVESRRSFLKKAAYVAPAVVALGTLTAPISANASIINLSHTNKNNGVTWQTQYDTTTQKYTGATKIDGDEVTSFNQTKLYNDKENLLERFAKWFGY